MPEKASLPLPLKEQFYAARYGGDFTSGPYLSRESAVEEAPADMGLTPGQPFQVGVMEPFRAEIDAYRLLNFILEAAAELSPQAAAWAASVSKVAKGPSSNGPGGNHADELEGALNLAFMGWLTRHEIHPAFGFVRLETISHHEAPVPATDQIIASDYVAVTPDGPKPAAEAIEAAEINEPVLLAARCGHRSRNGARCLWAEGHEGDHMPEPLPQGPSGYWHCQFRREDGKKCCSALHSQDEAHKHRFLCGKAIEVGGTCDLDEGHEGECAEVLF